MPITHANARRVRELLNSGGIQDETLRQQAEAALAALAEQSHAPAANQPIDPGGVDRVMEQNTAARDEAVAAGPPPPVTALPALATTAEPQEQPDPNSWAARAQAAVAKEQNATGKGQKPMELHPSASGNRHLNRPPVHSPGSTRSVLSELVNPAAMLSQDRVFLEPTIEQFRAEAAQIYGDSVAQMDEKSPQFQLYKDAKYAQAYDKAVAEGRDIARVDFMPGDDPLLKVAKFGVQARDAAEAGLTGILDGLSFGTGSELAAGLTEAAGVDGAVASMRNQQTRQPVANIAGTVVGAANPASAASFVTGVGRTALGPGASLAGNLGRAAAVGGAVGAAEGAAGAGAQALSNELRGDTSPTRGVGSSALLGGALGGGGGALGELIGAGASKAVSSLRQGRLAQQLPAAEAAGVRTGVAPKVTLPKSIRSNLDSATPDVSAVERAANKVMDPIADAAGRRHAGTKAKLGAENEAFYNRTAGKKASTAPLVERLRDIVARRSDEAGELPAVKTGEFHAIMDKAVKVKIVPDAEARLVAEAERGFVLKGREAARLGMQLEPGETIVLIPRQLDARAIDEVTEALDSLGKASAKNSGGAPDRAYEELMEAIRATREEIPGFSELKAKHAEVLGKDEALFAQAGLPPKPPGGGLKGLDPKSEAPAFEAAVRNFRSAGSTQERNLALRKLAKMAGVDQQLKEVAGTAAGQKLMQMERPGYLANNIPLLNYLVDPLRYDRPFRAMAEYGDAKSLSPELRRLLVRMRGGGADKLEVRRGHKGAVADNSLLAMRGGGLGPRLEAGYNAKRDTDQGSSELTPEDMDNLRALVHAAQMEQR